MLTTYSRPPSKRRIKNERNDIMINIEQNKAVYVAGVGIFKNSSEKKQKE